MVAPSASAFSAKTSTIRGRAADNNVDTISAGQGRRFDLCQSGTSVLERDSTMAAKVTQKTSDSGHGE